MPRRKTSKKQDFSLQNIKPIPLKKAVNPTLDHVAKWVELLNAA